MVGECSTFSLRLVLAHHGDNVVRQLRERQWLIQVVQARWRRYTTFQLGDRYVRIASDEYDFHIGVDFSNLTASRNTVNSGRHADIQNNDVKRCAFFCGRSCLSNRIQTLVACDDVELRRVLADFLSIEQICGKCVERLNLTSLMINAERISIALKHLLIIIGDKYANKILVIDCGHSHPPCAAGSST